MADNSFQGPPGGNWFDPAYWSLGVVPTPGSTADVAGTSEATIDGGVVSDVTISVTAAVPLTSGGIEPTTYSLYVGSSGAIDSASTVVVDVPFQDTNCSIHLATFGGELAVTDGTLVHDYDTTIDDAVTVSGQSIDDVYSGYAQTDPSLDRIVIDGSITVDNSEANLFAQSVSGPGVVTLVDRSFVAFAAPLGNASVAVDVDFGDGSASQLTIAQPGIGFSGTVFGFGGANTIAVGDGGGFAPDTIAFADDVLTVLQGSSTVVRIRFSGDYTAANFSISADDVISFVPDVSCFAAGTIISTPGGGRAVEALRAGDRVRTASGETRAIVWAGSRTVDLASHPDPILARPVVIRRDAFARGAPARDLVVSPDHNIGFEDVLIPAKCLVDGASVFVDMAASAVTYHHIELATHDLVLANGLAAETYLDVGNRAALMPGATSPADFSSAVDLNWFRWEALGCRRLVLAGAELDRARALLRARAQRVGISRANGNARPRRSAAAIAIAV